MATTFHYGLSAVELFPLRVSVRLLEKVVCDFAICSTLAFSVSGVLSKITSCSEPRNGQKARGRVWGIKRKSE